VRILSGILVGELLLLLLDQRAVCLKLLRKPLQLPLQLKASYTSSLRSHTLVAQTAAQALAAPPAA
jgi:hypothetical protein